MNLLDYYRDTQHKYLDPALTVGSGLLGEAVGGLMALPVWATQGTDEAMNMLNAVKERAQYTPENQAGIDSTKAVMGLLEPIGEYAEDFRQYTANRGEQFGDIHGRGDIGYTLGAMAPEGMSLLGVPATLKGASQLNKLGPKIIPKDAPTTPFSPQAGSVMSKQQAIDAGYWHPIGVDKKLRKPIDDYTKEIIKDPNATPRREIDWQDMVDRKATFINANSDRSAGSGWITNIDGEPLKNKVELNTGMDYMIHNPTGAWATNKGKGTALKNKAMAEIEAGRTPVMSSVIMGHGSLGHNKVLANAYFEMMDNADIPKKIMDDFNADIKKLRPEWNGIHDAETAKKFHENGEVRKAFMQVANLKKYKDALPDLASARFAVTDDSLLNVPIGWSGQSMRATAGKLDNNPEVPVEGFPTQIVAEGDYLGGALDGYPRGVFWRDWNAKRRASGAPENKDHISMERGHAMQRVDNEYVDGLLDFAEKQRQSAIDPDSEFINSPMNRKRMVGKPYPAQAENLLKQMEDTGGFSVEAFSGRKPDSGYMVGRYPNSDMVRNRVLDNVTPESIQNYMMQNRDVLSKPNSFAGGWLDEGIGYLDISENVLNYKDALKMAKKTDQKAIQNLNKYNLGNNEWKLPNNKGGRTVYLDKPEEGLLGGVFLNGRFIPLP